MLGSIIGYGLLIMILVLLGLSVRRIVRRRSTSCCSTTKTGGKALHAGGGADTGPVTPPDYPRHGKAH